MEKPKYLKEFLTAWLAWAENGGKKVGRKTPKFSRDEGLCACYSEYLDYINDEEEDHNSFMHWSEHYHHGESYPFSTGFENAYLNESRLDWVKKMLIEIDIPEIKLDISKSVETREGQKARIICTDKKCDGYPLVALIMCDDKEVAYSYTANGQFHESGHYDDMDLVNVVARHSTWQNIYQNCQSNHYATREEADTNSFSTSYNPRITILRRDYVDGLYQSCELESD